MSLGLTKEEVQQIIKTEVQALKASNDNDNLRKDFKIADRIKKYNALTIEFRSLKQNKLNKQQAPPDNEAQAGEDLGRGVRESFRNVGVAEV